LQVLSGLIFINRNGLKWCDAPGENGLPKTVCNRWKRWGDMGASARMIEGLASEGNGQKTIMIDATDLKAHRTALGLRVKKGGRDDQRGRLIGRTKGGLNTKLHAVSDAIGRPLKIFMSPEPKANRAGPARHISRAAAAPISRVGAVPNRARKLFEKCDTVG
jgi:transposase